MRKLILAAGVAALAMAVPAAAKPDKGGGQGGRGQAAKVERGGGGGQARAARSDRGAKAQRVERRGNRGQERAQNRGNRRERIENRGNRGEARVERRNERRAIARGRDRDELRQAARGDQRGIRGRDNVDLRRDSDFFRVRNVWEDRNGRLFTDRGLPPGYLGGCPPGLAKKRPACVPPGQVNSLVGQVLPAAYASHVLPLALRDYYRDTDDYYWRFGDGYLYRVDRGDDLIRSILPLIGAGLGVGMPFPYSSPSYYVPSYYQPFYPNTGDDYYRYANGYVYEIDRNTGLIEDMIPLLDRGYGVGQMLPVSYSYYNVPYPYRSWYMDDDDYHYRYAPGAIYQVDRDSQLITAVAALLSGGNSMGLAVGQPLPVGYDMYNVPFAYRDRYYDRPDAWYRYSNGYIYQVDPTTRLITAMVDAIV